MQVNNYSLSKVKKLHINNNNNNNKNNNNSSSTTTQDFSENLNLHLEEVELQ